MNSFAWKSLLKSRQERHVEANPMAAITRSIAHDVNREAGEGAAFAHLAFTGNLGKAGEQLSKELGVECVGASENRFWLTQFAEDC